MDESLLEWSRRTHPERFKIGWKKENRLDHLGRPSGHPCSHCIVKKRNPKDCDPCLDNPDRERMKRAGLL